MRHIVGAIILLAAGAGCAVEQAPPPQSPAIADFWVFFDHDSAAISAVGTATIRAYVQYMARTPKVRVVVTSHTDRPGAAAYNMNLSQRRAEAIRKALIDEGVSSDRITLKALGETQPLVQTPDGVKEPQNRRVELLSY